MGALPKKKVSRRRRGNRRAHQGIKLPSLSTCPNCHEIKVTHRVCLSCGTYSGRQVLDVKTVEGR